jgi:hypothetical protein
MRPKKLPREQAWREFAAARGGTVVADRRGKPKKLAFTHGPWMIVYDDYVVSTGKSTATYTRARALIRTRTDLRLKVFRENVFTRLGTKLGMQDIHVGHPELDPRFMVRGSNESVIRSALMEPRVVAALGAQRDGSLDVAPFKGNRKQRLEHVLRVTFTAGGVVTDPERLGTIHDLMTSMLDSLSRVVASSEEPIAFEL